MKIQSNQKNKIRELREKGLKIKEIATIMKVSTTTIRYHLDDKVKEKMIKRSMDKMKKLTPEARSKIYKKHYPYLKNYLKKRYHEDEVFRKKHIERCLNYQKRAKNE